MQTDGTTKIFADAADELEFQGALPSTEFLSARIHEVSNQVLQENLSKLMQQVEALFSSGASTLKTFTVKEVKVAVGVNGSGEFSLLGLAKATAELEVNFRDYFRTQNHGRVAMSEAVSNVPDAETARAINALETFQLRQYQRLGLSVPKHIDADELDRHAQQFPNFLDHSILPTLNKAIESGRGVPGSRFDDPLLRGYFHIVGTRLEKFVLPEVGLRTPIFGECPLLSPNAKVATSKIIGRPIIVVQRGLKPFLTQMIFALVHASPLRKKLTECSLEELRFTDRWNNLSTHQVAYAWIVEALLIAILGQPGLARAIAKDMWGDLPSPFEVSPIECDIATELHEATFSFIIAHEYRQRLEQLSPWERISFGEIEGVPPPVLDQFFRNQASEIIADNTGIGLSLRRSAASGDGPEIAYLSIVLFFEIMLLFESCVRTFRDGLLPEPNAMFAFHASSVARASHGG